MRMIHKLDETFASIIGAKLDFRCVIHDRVSPETDSSHEVAMFVATRTRVGAKPHACPLASKFPFTASG